MKGLGAQQEHDRWPFALHPAENLCSADPMGAARVTPASGIFPTSKTLALFWVGFWRFLGVQVCHPSLQLVQICPLFPIGFMLKKG